MTQAGCTHSPTVMSSPGAAQRRPKHLPRYLAEFCYRFNRRFDLTSMLMRLAIAATRTSPMPYRLVKLAEAHW